MIFVFKTRYSGWPCGGDWVACIERHDVEWVEPYVEELIDDVTSAGDDDASLASKEINRRCIVDGGDTAAQAIDNLMNSPGALAAIMF